jgi:hypothetical protein
VYRLLGRDPNKRPLTEVERKVLVRCLEEFFPKDLDARRIQEMDE